MARRKSSTAANGEFISNEDFVTAWQAADSAEEATEKLGANAANRAARLRKKGVPLKRFAAPHQRIDVDALTKLCE